MGWFLTQDLDMTYEKFRERQVALEAERNTDHRITYDRLYGDLGIIDSKVGALAQLVSIEAAIYSVVAATMPSDEWQALVRTGFLEGWQAWIRTGLLLAGSIGAYIGVVLCLSVVWLTWAGSAVEGTHSDHAHRMYRIRRGRTIRYRVGWVLATFAAILLPIYSAFALLAKF